MAARACSGQGKWRFDHVPMARRNNEQRSLNDAAARTLRDFRPVVESPLSPLPAPEDARGEGQGEGPLYSSACSPIGPPSSRVMAMVAERGRELPPSGQWLFGAENVPPSPGCWMLTNIVRLSGVMHTPVISQSTGPTRKRRRVSPLAC